MTARPIGVFILLMAVIASSIGVVYAKHQSRKLFIELQSLAAERDRMDVEWGQLQLEQGTLTTHGQIERAARDRLGMVNPAAGSVAITSTSPSPSTSAGRIRSTPEMVASVTSSNDVSVT